MNPADRLLAHSRVSQALALTLLASLALLPGCGKDDKKSAERPPAEVTVLTVEPRDTPVTATFVAQTQSSQAVNIQARVSGFLDKRMYVEGSVVKAGQVLFQMDQKPFQAQVDAQQAALARSQASLDVAKANLARTKPLAEQNALSQKDLDDAQGQYDSAAAAVEQGKAQLRGSEAEPVVYDDHVAGHRRLELRGGRRRHVPRREERAAHDRLGADADVDQLQHLGERDAADSQRGQKPACSGCPRTGASWSRSSWSTGRSSRNKGQDHVRRSVVQPADRYVPDPRVGRQSRRHAAAESVRADAADRRRAAQLHPRPATRRPAGRARAFRLGRQQGRQGGATARAGRRLVRRLVVHLARSCDGRPGRRRRGAAPRARTRRSRRRRTCRSLARPRPRRSRLRPARRWPSISRRASRRSMPRHFGCSRASLPR